jgi:hypothetical protein
LLPHLLYFYSFISLAFLTPERGIDIEDDGLMTRRMEDLGAAVATDQVSTISTDIANLIMPQFVFTAIIFYLCDISCWSLLGVTFIGVINCFFLSIIASLYHKSSNFLSAYASTIEISPLLLFLRFGWG